MINFGQISIIAPLSNIAIVPIIPLVMLSGFLSLLAGYFSPYIGVVLGFPTWMGLSYILNGIKWFGEFSYATVPINLGLHQYFFEILYFMIIVFIILFFHQKET
jgi:competence protein ComEC